MTEPIELAYAVFLLPAGRVAFRRWRWELWHGPQLLAAGWRTGPLQAQRAVRVHALRHAHRVHGLHPLRLDAGDAPEREWLTRPVRVQAGDLQVRLTPRDLDAVSAQRAA